ncbi:hypothetical protein [Bacillus infantis]|uniref:Uncharacterized protein n=1 Tax=Bacillus infantis TaxID=324767 RepID=A0A5D4R5V2_9BACI|nr:hypothetical protein [Bacillus infantis]TYS46747.1 hypothetical protein FZD51_14845 [Bacillus infantis]
MYYLFLEDNKTFKKHLQGLCEKKIITNEIKSLPRKNGLEITLNELVIPELNKKRGFFTQLPTNVLNREVIQVAGHVGVRMLYYYKSYINAKDWSKQYCFVAEETAAEDLGITVKTIIKYNTLLKKWKFLKIDKHEVGHGYGDNKHGQEQLLFTKYNNHYFLRQDEIDKFCEEHRSNLTQNA